MVSSHLTIFPTLFYSLKYCGSAVACSSVFTRSHFCSRVTHIVHHKTCPVTTHGQSHLSSCWDKNGRGLIRNAFFASCSSSSSAHVAVELDSIFASVKHRESGFQKVDLIVHGKMTFLFTTEYVKIRLQLQILS